MVYSSLKICNLFTFGEKGFKRKVHHFGNKPKNQTKSGHHSTHIVLSHLAFYLLAVSLSLFLLFFFHQMKWEAISSNAHLYSITSTKSLLMGNSVRLAAILHGKERVYHRPDVKYLLKSFGRNEDHFFTLFWLQERNKQQKSLDFWFDLCFGSLWCLSSEKKYAIHSQRLFIAYPF